MIFKNKFSLFLAIFLIIGFLFLALPEKGYSGVRSLGCCQIEPKTDPPSPSCEDITREGDLEECKEVGGEFFEGEVCIDETFCARPARNVPTLSEWGLITMAGILGIVGFMVMRRRKVAA